MTNYARRWHLGSKHKGGESYWQVTSPQTDGGMGSLLILPKGIKDYSNRSFGEYISKYQFKDEDDTDVIVSLSIDNEGRLFELDIWKTDFSPLINIPEI